MDDIKPFQNEFYSSIKQILDSARNRAYQQVNFIMVEAYWNIGKSIVEEEQNGEDRAKYGSYLIKELSKRLTADFGKGFSQQSLWNMRQFYNSFPILSTLWRELSWSHYKLIIRLDNSDAREWYMKETFDPLRCPLDSKGGRGKMYQLFKADMMDIIEEMNEALVA